MLICSYLACKSSTMKYTWFREARLYRSVMLNDWIYHVDLNTYLTLALILGTTLVSPLEGYKYEVTNEPYL